jgi:VIT1/CCC1 family predicted Fe2+/Mn2+ transporter
MLARFIDTYLAPSDRLAETLCGLIMVLSFTLVAAPQVKEGPEGVRTLLLATIGCNVAWGVIDGVLYVLCAVTQRAQRWRVVRRVKAAGDEAAAVEALRVVLDEELPEDAPEEARGEFYRGLARLVSGVKVQPVDVTLDDILGGLAILLVEGLCTLPAALPFLLFRDHWTALRTSNALLLLLLFVAGYRWGAATTGKPWRAGMVMLLFGAGLVGVALALGG